MLSVVLRATVNSRGTGDENSSRVIKYWGSFRRLERADLPPTIRSLAWSYGNVATGSVLTTAEVGYITVPFACTIVGWHIMADSGTVIIKTARVNGGENLPTLRSNSISTSGVSLSRGTKVDSSAVADFKSTAIAPNDTLGFFLTDVARARQITFSIDCAE